jgi:hypothetical protein
MDDTAMTEGQGADPEERGDTADDGSPAPGDAGPGPAGTGDPGPASTGGAGTGGAGTGDPGPAGGKAHGLRRFTRRQMLSMAGAGGLVGAGLVANRWIADTPASSTQNPPRPSSTTSATESVAPTPAAASGRWSDPATWGGAVPGEADVVVVDTPVVLDVDARVAGVRIGPGGELTFDPAQSRTLESTGNVEVAGVLRARPERADLVHRLTFPGIDESAFVGDHTMEPYETDVGLWVVAGGVLDLQGARKRPWTNRAAPADAGATTISVADPSGWQVGDEIVVTPTEPTTVDGHAEHHDRRVVTGVDGSTVGLDRPLDHSHPEVTVRPGIVHRPEVLNLTRNVRIEGTPEGRTHVIVVGAGRPQTIGFVGLRHTGPQQDGVPVVGRYAMHFHMDDDATQGTLLEGLVAYEGGNHAFVSHTSHGITMRECIAHDQFEDPFWWDQSDEDHPSDMIPTNDLVYDRCVASHVKSTEQSRYGISGFTLGAGSGNAARGCVATGVLGGGDESTSGYNWPADSRDENTWVFEDNIAHNCDATGIYFWQNEAPRTIVDRFTAYHDTRGVFAGAYSNLASYRDSTIYACALDGLVVNAVPEAPPDGSDETITYEGIYVDQAGLTDYAVEITDHVVGSERATLVSGGHFLGGTVAQVGFRAGDDYPQVYVFTGCTFEGNAFWLPDDMPELVDIRVTDAVHGSIVLRPAGREGEPRSEWNAAVTPA